MVRAGWLRWAPWLICLAALLFTLHNLRQQAVLSASLGQAMSGVKQHVADAGTLTWQTADALAPLSATTASLERMNGRLEAVAADLSEMNAIMGRVTKRQESILRGVRSLNDRTRTLTGSLARVNGTNEAMLGATEALTAQAAEQAGALEQLSLLTGQAIANLDVIYQRFRFLLQY